MSEYRDFGAAYNPILGIQYGGDPVPVDTKRYTQVYQATHKGEDRLPLFLRSFISFTYGGRAIEDLNLIATTIGNRIERNGYANFDDTVTTYDSLNGQQYWGTHYRTNSIVFNLSTDGMDQRQLDDFLNWFAAGVTRELVLAEHPNRGILARVSEPPRLALLPFEKKTSMVISEVSYDLRTTLYRGEITLTMVMDDPYWYSLQNILGKKVVETDKELGELKTRYVDTWIDYTDPNYPDGKEVSIIASADALKVLYEDGIPLGSMIQKNMLLGDNTYARVEGRPEEYIWDKNEEDADFWQGQGARVHGKVSWEWFWKHSREVFTTEDPEEPVGLYTEHDTELWFDKPEDFKRDWREHYPGNYLGRIFGPIVDAGGNGVELLGEGEEVYFFYAGTAPAPTELTFTVYPTLGSNFVTSPFNKYTNGIKYNTITIEGIEEQKLCFTLPNVFTSYNQAVHLFDTECNSNTDWEHLRALIRDSVRHPRAREWAIKVADYGEKYSINDGGRLGTCMSYFIRYNGIQTASDGFTPIPYPTYPMTVTFNSETGKATGLFFYRLVTNSLPETDNEWATYGNCPSKYKPNESLSNFASSAVEEDVGDMLLTNHLIIRDRNYPTKYGKIEGWDGTTIEGKQYSHRITHDVPQGLVNFMLAYRNMYL